MNKLADVLIAAAQGVVHAFPAAGKPAAVTAGKPATATTGKPANNKLAPAAKAGNGAADKPGAAAKPSTKPGAKVGQYTSDQVKDKMREVLQAPGGGRDLVISILDEECNGAKSFGDVKVEQYDALYEAFGAALKGGETGEGQSGADAGDDLGV